MAETMTEIGTTMIIIISAELRPNTQCRCNAPAVFIAVVKVFLHLNYLKSMQPVKLLIATKTHTFADVNTDILKRMCNGYGSNM